MSKFANILKTYGEMASSLATLRWFKVGYTLYKLKFLRANLTEHFVEVENGTVHYWSGGSGDTLVMIHGFGVDGVLNWPDQVGPLAKEYFLVVPDLMWFGESESTKEEYSNGFQTDTIEQLLQKLNIKKLHLLGHSEGGLVSALLAARLPDQVQRLILVDSPAAPKVFTEEDKEHFRDVVGVERASELLVPETTADLRRLFELGYYKPPRAPDFVLKDTLPHFKRRENERRAMADHIEDNSDNLFPSDHHITQDTLVIWGEYDALLPLKIGERVTSSIGENARFKILPDSGHAPNLEKPKEFNRIVLDFLAKS